MIPRRTSPDLGFALAVAAALWVVTQVPFEVTRRLTPPDKAFTDSFVFQADYSIYFSYVRQAAEGDWIFENRVTSEEQPRIFVNGCWLVLGWLKAALGLSWAGLFHVWRLLGALVFVGAFAWAASLFVEPLGRRRVALLAFATGGGFGWIVLAAEKLGLPHFAGGWWLGLVSGPGDTFAAFHPFLQVFLFPFHALSAGLLVATLAIYAAAERRDSAALRLAAGAGTLALGFVRPHEMTVAGVAIFLHACLRLREDGVVSARTASRAAALALPLPAVAYYAYVVSADPIFRWLHEQNVLPPLLPLDLALTLGLAGIAAARNLPAVAARRRLDPAVPVLLTWLAAAFGLFYAYPVMRYSLEFGNALVAPVLLLAFAAPAAGAAPPVRWQPPGRRRAVLAALLVLNAATSVWLLAARSREWRHPERRAFVDARLVPAFAWLEARTARSDVVLSLIGTGHWILRYGGNKVFIASPVSTVNFKEKQARSMAFFEGRLPPAEAAELLRRSGVRWVFFGPQERAAGLDPASVPGLRRAYASEAVEIFEVGAAAAAEPVAAATDAAATDAAATDPASDDAAADEPASDDRASAGPDAATTAPTEDAAGVAPRAGATAEASAPPAPDAAAATPGPEGAPPDAGRP